MFTELRVARFLGMGSVRIRCSHYWQLEVSETVWDLSDARLRSTALSLAHWSTTGWLSFQTFSACVQYGSDLGFGCERSLSCPPFRKQVFWIGSGKHRHELFPSFWSRPCGLPLFLMRLASSHSLLTLTVHLPHIQIRTNKFKNRQELQITYGIVDSLKFGRYGRSIIWLKKSKTRN